MPRPPTPTRALSLCLVAGAGGLFAGCSSGGGGASGGSSSSSGGILESIFAPSPPANTNSTSTRPSQDNEPMTLFEKRRLVARLQQDPHALQRLTPRERREVAAMAAAANRGKDDDKANN